MLRIDQNTIKDARTDEQLLDAFRSGKDGYALGTLYARYMPMVLGLCLNILKDKGKAEDAVIGIYESLSQKIGQHSVENFRPWLYVTARNFCLMEWRKQKRRPTDLYAPDEMARFDSQDEISVFEPDVEQEALKKCIEALIALQKQCVNLFYYQEKSYKEIADALQMELGLVRSHIQNGRRNLKICMEKTLKADE